LWCVLYGHPGCGDRDCCDPFDRGGARLAANTGANQLVALTEGFQSAFLAVAILAGIGVAVALLLLGRPRGIPQAQPDLERSVVPAAD
jgi:hypothetical protein